MLFHHNIIVGDYLIPKPYSYYRYFHWRIPFPFSRVRGFRLGNMVFLWGCWSMGLRLGFFLCGSSNGSWWFHGTGIGVVLSVRLGSRYRLLWFGSSGDLGGWAWLENGKGLC